MSQLTDQHIQSIKHFITEAEKHTQVLRDQAELLDISDNTRYLSIFAPELEIRVCLELVVRHLTALEELQSESKLKRIIRIIFDK